MEHKDNYKGDSRIGHILYKAKRLEGLMNTKYFGIKKRARHNDAKRAALQKARGETPF